MCKCLKNINWKNIALQFWAKICTSIKFILKFLLIYTFLVITYNFAIDKNNTAMIIFAAFSLFFILFFFSSKFELVELLGAKFKLRETISQATQLVDILAEQIMILATTMEGGWAADDYTEENKDKEKVFLATRKLELLQMNPKKILELRIKYYDNNFLKRSFDEFLSKLDQPKEIKNKFLHIENYDTRLKEMTKHLTSIKSDESTEFQKLLKKYTKEKDEESIQAIIDFVFKEDN